MLANTDAGIGVLPLYNVAPWAARVTTAAALLNDFGQPLAAPQVAQNTSRRDHEGNS